MSRVAYNVGPVGSVRLPRPISRTGAAFVRQHWLSGVPGGAVQVNGCVSRHEQKRRPVAGLHGKPELGFGWDRRFWGKKKT